MFCNTHLHAHSDGGVAHSQQWSILGPVEPAHSEVSITDPLHHGDVEIPAEDTERESDWGFGACVCVVFIYICVCMCVCVRARASACVCHLSRSWSGGCSSWVCVAPNRLTTDNLTAGFIWPAWRGKIRYSEMRGYRDIILWFLWVWRFQTDHRIRVL